MLKKTQNIHRKDRSSRLQAFLKSLSIAGGAPIYHRALQEGKFSNGKDGKE